MICVSFLGSVRSKKSVASRSAGLRAVCKPGTTWPWIVIGGWRKEKQNRKTPKSRQARSEGKEPRTQRVFERSKRITTGFQPCYSKNAHRDWNLHPPRSSTV